MIPLPTGDASLAAAEPLLRMEHRQKKLLIRIAVLAGVVLMAFLLKNPVLGVVWGWRYEANLKKAEAAYETVE